MALPATDIFDAANGTPLQTYSANWTINAGAVSILGGAVHADSASAESAAHWDADVFANDQYAQGVLVAAGTAGPMGVAVRCNLSGSANYYGFYGSTTVNGGELFKVVGLVYTILGAARAAFAVNDVIRCEVSGTTLSAFRNAVLQGTTQTDSTFSSGAAGVAGYSNNTSNLIDSWEGGNLSVAVPLGGRIPIRQFRPNMFAPGIAR